MRAGKTMKQAAASWKKGQKRKSPTTSKTKRSRKTTSKNNSKRGLRLVGSMGPKGLITTGVLLALSKYILRTKAPQLGAYTTGVAALAAGLVGKILGSGASLLTFGVVDTAAELLTDLALPGGMVNMPSWGGGGGQTGNGNGNVRYNVG